MATKNNKRELIYKNNHLVGTKPFVLDKNRFLLF